MWLVRHLRVSGEVSFFMGICTGFTPCISSSYKFEFLFEFYEILVNCKSVVQK